MVQCKNRGFFSGKVLWLVYWFWNLTVLGKVTSISGVSSDANSSYMVSSHSLNLAGQAKESRIAASAIQRSTPANPRNTNFADGQEFPLWIIVVIVVTGGFLLVASVLCLIKLHRWKKDHGTYSMWSNHRPSVDAMYTRESGVLFARSDVETSLAEAQCYEIPVDSFQIAQKIYDMTPKTEQEPVNTISDLHMIDSTQYTPAKDSSDVAIQRTSVPCSIGPDASQRSSSLSTSVVSTSTVSERGSIPGHEVPRELYPKPLPVVVVKHSPSVPCEAGKLDVDENEERVSALVNRPLPQTPHLCAPSLDYSATSLDRTLLKQQKETKMEKPTTFRTLPRPKRIRQIPLPFFNSSARSCSQSDVSKEAERLRDHVASDPKKCTLTRVKKRLSQSLDTVLGASERVSHLYEIPYQVERIEGVKECNGSTSGNAVDPSYTRVSSTSEENLPKDKEHLYTRISQYMDGEENCINRHSYASIHYPPSRARPKSKHVYISIIFGSADSVFVPSIDDNTKPKLVRAKSKSCPSLDSSQSGNDAFQRYNPRPHSYYPPANDPSGLYSIESRTPRSPASREINNDLFSFPDSQYQNIRESLGIPETHHGVVNNGYQNVSKVNLPLSSQSGTYKTPKNLNLRPYYENITSARGNTAWEQDKDGETGHYTSPKTPAIPLQRFTELLRKTSEDSARHKTKEDESLEICGRKRSANNAKNCMRHERETFSAYLEGRFNGEQEISEENHEPTYENFIPMRSRDISKKEEVSMKQDFSRNHEVSRKQESSRNDEIFTNEDIPIQEETTEKIGTNRDSSISTESDSINERLSLASSLSLDDEEEIYEHQPLISKTSDENGNSVCDRFLGKLEVRRKSIDGNSSFGESLA